MGLQEPLNFTSLGSCDGTKGFKLSNPRVNWPVAADCQFSQREPENKVWPRSTLVLNSNLQNLYMPFYQSLFFPQFAAAVNGIA